MLTYRNRISFTLWTVVKEIELETNRGTHEKRHSDVWQIHKPPQKIEIR